jgi:type VI secretion system protein ImpG
VHDRLLDYYQRELTFIRDLGAEFAKLHPKIAGRLRLDADSVEDPHVARFIEASALLSARTRIKIDDQFPEICQAILQTLYPHYIAPVPPAAIVELSLKELATENLQPLTLQRGSRIETDPIGGEPCRFRTCYDTQLWPIRISQIDYLSPPLPFSISPWNRDVQSAIRIRLHAPAEKVKIDRLQIQTLRFFLGGSSTCSNMLVQALMGQCLGTAISNGRQTEFLPNTSIEQVGFADDEALLPQNPRGIPCYRLLTEFFSFHHKYRFADINFGSSWNKLPDSQYVDVVFFLKQSHAVLVRELDKDTIKIGCTPMVNLFPKRAEPIRQTANQTEYRVVGSSRAQSTTEIYSIDRVTALTVSGQEQTFLPFYHPDHSSDQQLYWHARRDRALGVTSEDDRGTELYISTTNLTGLADSDDNRMLDVETTCLNRDLVASLPFGGGQPRLNVATASGAINAMCITPPTPTLRPTDDSNYYWRLISHLSLNQLSLTDSDSGSTAVREILRLYNHDETGENPKAIGAILSISYKRSTARVADKHGANFCRGIDVEVLLDSERLSGTGEFLFASILDRFFSLYASINSFTRLTVRSRENNAVVYIGKPRAGMQQLI